MTAVDDCSIAERVLPPSVIFIGGTCASGKSVVTEKLAARIGYTLHDGDHYHPPSNVAKMSAGTALTDEDRLPWLRTLGKLAQDSRAAGRGVVVACSALKHVYRDILTAPFTDAECRVVMLYVPRTVLEERLAKRQGHFFDRRLLDSQLATLELPESGDDEPHTIVIDASHPLDDVIQRIVRELNFP